MTKRHIDWTYFLIFLFILILQRMDVLVCSPLWEKGYGYQFSWWVFLTILVIIVSLLLYVSHPSKQNLWYATLTLLLYVGGFLDFLYILEVPFPQMWLDPNFIHFWNIFYIFLGYPWTIKEQIVWWICWAGIIAGLYVYLRDKYGIRGLVIKNEDSTKH